MMTQAEKTTRNTGNNVRSKTALRRKARRRGAVLVWFALLLVILVGMTGLVIDGGLLMSAHRHAYNAADAGALAAAHDLLYGKSQADATATAIAFVKEHNGLSHADDPIVNIPPASGPYAGLTNYVEVIVSNPRQTFLIHVLPGIDASQTVTARAVAGIEAIASGAGVVALDPAAKPGIKVSGGARLIVEGSVFDNSEGGGFDANGNPVGNDGTGVAAFVSNNSEFIATDFHIVGGVNDPENFQPYDPLAEAGSTLHTGQLPVPDPLATLPTPTVDTGVADVYRGAPKSTDGGYELGNPNPDPLLPNYVDTDPETGEETLVLHPGIYESIEITGGNVRFEPGIYVLSPTKRQTVLKITGGNVVAEGIMFYNTGSDYNPYVADTNQYNGPEPPSTDGVYFGGVRINAGMHFSPIDLETYALEYGDNMPAEEFDGMLFFQDRRNTQSINIEGNSEDGNLTGTVYAKWADLKIAGQGTYDAQFVVGSIKVVGTGDVTINYTGEDLGKAPQVFLVE